MRTRIAAICAFLLILAACGTSGDDSGGQANTSDIDVCALLSEAELLDAVGVAPDPQPTEPSGPFTGCSWGGGFLIVQIAAAVTLITAPLEGESDCPSPEIGDESIACFGGVKFLTNGIHTSIATIENVTEAQMISVAKILLPKLQA